MNGRVVFLSAVLAIASAQGLRALAKAERAQTSGDEPFAPSPAAAPLVSLGYRELLADLLFFRLVGYFGDDDHTAEGVASLVEAIAATDPHYEKIYTWGSRAMVAARHGQRDEISVRAATLVESGAKLFPDNWQIPKLAGEMWLFDVVTKDPEERRKLDEHAVKLLDAAIYKPSAPADLATLVAHLRTKHGQRQRAIDGLKEMLFVTDDKAAREQLLQKLAEVMDKDRDEIAAEELEARKRFEDRWHGERPAMPRSMYLLVGPRPRPGFDLRDLAAPVEQITIDTLRGE